MCSPPPHPPTTSPSSPSLPASTSSTLKPSSNLWFPRHASLVPQHILSWKSSNRKQTVTVEVTGILSMLTGFISMPIACKHAGQRRGSRGREGGRRCEYKCKCNKILWPVTSVSLECGQPLCLKALGVTQFTGLLQGTLWPRTILLLTAQESSSEKGSGLHYS